MSLKFLACAVFVAVMTTAAAADNWTASKLFGKVQQFEKGQWVTLSRGDIVADGTLVRTQIGRVTLIRGTEVIDLGGDTQVQIFDRATGGKPFTTVKQFDGEVSVKADVEQVQHFAVETPYLAAVVKGTRFTVTSGDTGASVFVHLGHVAVTDGADGTHVTVGAGQSASVAKGPTVSGMVVSGRGDLPQILTALGKPLKANGKGNGQAHDNSDNHGQQVSAAARAGSNGKSDSSSSNGNGNDSDNGNSSSAPGQSDNGKNCHATKTC